MLICDKRRPRTRGDTNIRPPQGGRIKTAPPASGPRLWRSLAGGLHPQTPRAAPPGAPSRAGPLLPRSPSRRGSGHGCARWRGWATRQRCPRSTPSPSPSPLCFQFFKGGPCGCAAGGFGGRAPRCRAAVGNPAQAVGGQGAAAGCARRPRTGRGCPRATGPQGRALDH